MTRRGEGAGVSGRYRTIVCDPPWPGDWFPTGIGGRRRNLTPPEYRLMTIEDIAQLPVADLCDNDAHLFLWVPARLNREGIGVRIARAWGFEPTSEFVWDKPNLGMGSFPRACHEVMLVARRGNLPFTGPLNVRSVQQWSQQYTKNHGKRHSAKPEGAIDLIEQASPGPYVELFARRQRMGWSTWGLECFDTAGFGVSI